MPTFHGFVHNSMDGLILFEACLSGKLHHVPRRPHDRERSSLIKSGSIFIYEENASGIKRWTDGVAWSPSRILGNFLIYRELEKPFPPGEKKRAMKRKRTSMPGEPYPRRDSDDTDGPELTTPLTPPTPNMGGEVKSELPSSDQDKELERSLIGSLVDSYGFRPDGLVKKTMSISINGISHHMVSYYKVDDVKNNALPRPLSDPRLQSISVRPELYLKQNFRAPVEETEHYAIDGQNYAHPQMMYSSVAGGAYGVRPGQYFGGQYPAMFSLTTTGGGMYSGMTGTSWPTQTPSTAAVSYGQHPGYAPQNYAAYYRHGSQSGSAGVKTEDQQTTSQSMNYAQQYPSTYPGMSRDSTQGTPSTMHSSYQTPVQQGSSTFGSMSAQSARPSWANTTMASPATNGQSHQIYTQPQGAQSLPSQQYAVRSPAQNYGLQSAPQSAVSHSPHPGIKSPHSATHPGTPAQSMHPDHSAQMHAAQMPYRAGSYAVSSTPQSAQPNGDMNGLGISGQPTYSNQPQDGHSYHGYGSSGQAFRPIGSVAASGHGGAQYSQ